MTTSSVPISPLHSGAIVNLATRRRLRQCVDNLIALADSHTYTASGMLRLLADANATYGDDLVAEIAHVIERDQHDEASRGISLLHSIATPAARLALWDIFRHVNQRPAVQSAAMLALHRLGEPVTFIVLQPPGCDDSDCL